MGNNELSYHPPVPGKKIPDGVLGILFLLSAEVMYFAGLISAYIIGRAGEFEWPPYGQPRLPVEVTAVNTTVLLASGFAGWLFLKNISGNNRPGKPISLQLLLLSIALGIVFLIVQGSEWARLVGFGLTSTSSLYGAFFYVIIGSHAVHAFAGLVALLYLFFFLKKHGAEDARRAVVKSRICLIYWYFVVGIWPLLYFLVYLL